MSPRTRTQDLPGRLKAVYDFIIEYKSTHDGNAPTMKEIALAVVKKPTTSLASFYVDKLIERKMLEKRDGAICIPCARWLPPEIVRFWTVGDLVGDLEGAERNA